MAQQVDTLPDETRGIMHRIREHLEQGKSSQEVIALGYAPGSVYKSQRELRRRREGKGEPAARSTAEVQVPVVTNEVLIRMEQLETENAELRTQMAELRQEVERVTSPHSQLDQLQWQNEGLSTKVERSQEVISDYAQEQQPRIEALERQVQRLDEVVCLLSLLVYHLDVHHRQQIHRWPPDPADRDVQPSDQGYLALLQRVRGLLAEAMTGTELRQQFGLPVRFKNPAQDVHHQQLLPRLMYLNRQAKP
jgi:vacuolar-type H+-ATPase subunit I/STV1